jgi:hypothetical protein
MMRPATRLLSTEVQSHLVCPNAALEWQAGSLAWQS